MKPTPEELAALRRFADRYSRRTWKRVLRRCWMDGAYGWSEDAAILEGIRNRLGPGWLYGFRFPREALDHG